jgi:hypothetical protein
MHMPRRPGRSCSISRPPAIPWHGHREGRLFHGYYDGHDYLPLSVFLGPHLLAAKRSRANIDGAASAVKEGEGGPCRPDPGTLIADQDHRARR